MSKRLRSGLALAVLLMVGETLSSGGEQNRVSMYFPDAAARAVKIFSSIQVAVRCAHISGVTDIPEYWNVRTLRAAWGQGQRWEQFENWNEGLELEAELGSSRIADLRRFNGAIHFSRVESDCFDVTVVVRDEIGAAIPDTVFRKSDLVFR